MGVSLKQFTAVAGQATQFAYQFNAVFSAGFEGRYRVDLTAPVGPSTSGGKQSLQHVRLVPLDGAPAIVIGSVSPVEKTAEIRTFRHLAEIHARRFNGARVPLDVNAHRDLVRRMSHFFTSQSFSVVMVDLTETPMSDRPPPPPNRGGSQTPWIIAGVALAVAAGTLILAVAMLTAPPKARAPSASASATAVP